MLAKRYLQMQGIQATVPQILALVKENPTLQPMLDKLDPDAIADYILSEGGAPAAIIRDDQQIALIRKQRQKQQQQQMKLQNMQSLADAYQKGAQAPEEGSASEQLMGGGEE